MDTGFSGYLTLPFELVELLGLNPRKPLNVTLATNLSRRVRSFGAQVRWHYELRSIRVLEASGTPLVGMRLLAGSRLTIQVRSGGEVLIEEL